MLKSGGVVAKSRGPVPDRSRLAPAMSRLEAYEAERLPKTAEIVRSNRMGGPERVLDLVAERAPDGFARLEDIITSAERATIVGGYARLTGSALPMTHRPPSGRG